MSWNKDGAILYRFVIDCKNCLGRFLMRTIRWGFFET
jgi:hypothetical protein